MRRRFIPPHSAIFTTFVVSSSAQNDVALNVRSIWMEERLSGVTKPHYLSSGEIRTVRFELYSDAVLSRDIAEHRLRRGDLVKIVDHHKSVDGEIGYSIEVFNATGETIAVAAVPESALEPLHKDEVLSVRPLAVT